MKSNEAIVRHFTMLGNRCIGDCDNSGLDVDDGIFAKIRLPFRIIPRGQTGQDVPQLHGNAVAPRRLIAFADDVLRPLKHGLSIPCSLASSSD